MCVFDVERIGGLLPFSPDLRLESVVFTFVFCLGSGSGSGSGCWIRVSA